ncbi:MAG: flagellar basal body rod protein FlgC [Pseudomonadota bacterium]
MDILSSMMISASGMKAQSSRMRIVAENLANANSTALSPEGDPYRRRMPSFKSVLNSETGLPQLTMARVIEDKSPFTLRYEPNHPAADKDGYIKLPNVNSLVEMMDMKEAQRSYEANLSVISTSRSMLLQTVALLR